MGFLDTLKTVGGAASDVGSVLGPAGAALSLGKGIAGLFGKSNQEQQIAQQKELMSYQNKLAQENSLLDYQRQRQLTQDNAMLQKIGMRQAGMNTALGDGTVASAASSGSTGSPTPPSALPTDASVDSQYSQMMNNSVSLIGNLGLQRAQKEFIDEQAENQRIRTLTQVQRDLAELREKAANAKGKETENSYKSMLYDAEKRYVEMNAKNKAWSLENDNYMKDLQSFYFQDMQVAQLENVRQDYINKLDTHDLNKQEKSLYEYKVREIEARIESLRASVADSLSHVGVNNSQTELNKQNKDNKRQEFDHNEESWSDVLATIKKNSVPDNLYQKIQLWHKDGTFEKLDGFQQLGYSLYEAFTSLGVKPSDALALVKILKK